MNRRLVLVSIACVTTTALAACVSDAPTNVYAADGGAPAEGGTAGDASSGADAGGDGADAATAPACDLSKPFGAAAVVPNVSSMDDELSARISADGLTLYLSSTRAGGPAGANLYAATRASTAADFGAPTLLADVSSAGPDTDPTVTADGLTMFLSSRVAQVSSGSLDIFVSKSTAGDFGPFVDVASVASTADDTAPYLVPSALYFASTRLGASQAFRAPIAGNSPSAPVAAFADGADGGGADVLFPVPTNDEKTLYFGSLRMDPLAKGQEDIWLVSTTTPGVAFATPSSVAELNTASREWPSSLTPDGCTLYFISDRTGGPGGLDVYRASKPK